MVLSPQALEQETQRALAAVGRALFIADWPEVPVLWNRRLRRAGRAVIDTWGKHFQRARIELSPTYFEVYPDDLYGILVHEVVHVGLAYTRRPFGHGPAFRAACLDAGGLLHSRWLPGRVYRYRCPVCDAELERRRRVSDSRWCWECAEAASAAGLDPYAPERSLVLVGTTYRGPERGEGTAPVCESGTSGATDDASAETA